MDTTIEQESDSSHSIGPIVDVGKVTDGLPGNTGENEQYEGLTAVDYRWQLPKLKPEDCFAIPNSPFVHHLPENQQGDSQATNGPSTTEVMVENDDDDSGVGSRAPRIDHRLNIQAMTKETEQSRTVSTCFLRIPSNTTAESIPNEPTIRTFYGSELENNRPLHVISIDGTIQKVAPSTFLQGNYDVKLLCICTPTSHPLIITIKPLDS